MKQALHFTVLFFLSMNLSAQERPLNTGLSNDEQYAFVGMTLEQLIERFGPPRTVAVSRGIETWQDDAVFRYTGVDFYIYINRVWQVQFTALNGISHGDRKTAVLLILGDAAEDKGDHVLMPVNTKDWTLMLRINFNSTESTGQVAAIFLYRPDFY